MPTRAITRLFIIAALILAAALAPGAALAAPAPSEITEPADPAFVTADVANPGTLHVAGTRSGGSGDVDLRCYAGAGSAPVASGVAVANGAFTVDVPITKALVNSLGDARSYCVLRAVPAGTIPSPAVASIFTGPHVGWGVDRPLTIGLAGAPNPPDTVFDYFVARAQARGYSDYYSAGSCGICDTLVFDPLTSAASNPIWFANAALYNNLYPGGNRSEVQVDGVDVYDPGSLYGPASELRNNPGLMPLTYSTSVDPATGDLTIHESDPFVPCSPQPATWPPTDATCPSFGAAAVTLERTITQDHDGLQIKVADHWHSNDAQPHQLDAVYDDTNDDSESSIAGHESVYDFTWTCANGFRTYAKDTDIAPPTGGPVTLYVQTAASTPEAGDGKNPFGALTYGTPPTSLRLRHGASSTAPYGDWQTRYLRTVPANGDLVITQVYSHDLALASVQALAHEAEQALPLENGGQPQPLPCPPPASPAPPADSTPVTSASDSTPAATPPASVPAAAAVPPVKCVVPKLRGRTLRSTRRLLRLAHCRLGRVTRVQTSRVPARRVVRTRPRPGTKRAPGTRITVTVAAA